MDVTEQVHFTCCLRKGCFCLPEPQEGGAPGSGAKKPVGESGVRVDRESGPQLRRLPVTLPQVVAVPQCS